MVSAGDGAARVAGQGRLPPADERARGRSLARLGATLGRLRAQLGPIQAELHALGAAEATRRLSADEARRVTRLRLESEGLRLELAALQAEFARLRRAGAAPA